MLKKTLAICGLTLCSLMSLQAIEIDQDTPSSLPIEISSEETEEQQDNLAYQEEDPSILVCEEKDELEALVYQEEENEDLTCKEKDLTPGALVCDGSEENCTSDGEKEESLSSILFSVFCHDKKDEKNLLACKDCK